MKTSKTQKIITGEIADASGHTDFSGSIEEAVAVIMENVRKFGKWAYINEKPFTFPNNGSAQEEAEVYAVLNEAENPHFVLTGKLQGGNFVSLGVSIF